MKLDIGCGKNKRQGFIGLDINPDSNADIIASATNLPIGDAEASEINCSHLVEHLYPDEARQFFKEVFRVLAAGGIAKIKIDRDWSKRRLFRKDPEHRCRYNGKEIKGMVQQFDTAKVKQSMYIIGRHLRTKIFVELRK